MYETGGHLPVRSLPAGSTFLCHGPPMTGKRDLCLALLAAGGQGECPVLLSTDSSVASIRADYDRFRPADADGGRLAVVDSTGEHGGSERPLVRTASSPADLTGAGVGMTTLMETLYEGGECERFRVGICSLTSTFLYAEPERALKFVHVMTQRVAESNALGVFVIQPDSVGEEVFNQLRTLVDGAIELRESGSDDRECRLRGIPDAPDGWHPVGQGPRNQVAVPSAGSGADTAAKDISDDDWLATEGSATDWAAGRGETGEFDSLHELIEHVDAERPTLTVYDFDGDEEGLSALARHCETMNVEFRQASLGPSHPDDVAMLHRGSDLIDAVSVQSLLGALEVSDSDVAAGAFAETEGATLLSDLSRSTFGARGASKSFLIDVSHVIELEAWRTGRGELHASFQELSRLWGDAEARRIYRRLAESGIAVHVYGTPDVEPPEWDGVTTHAIENEEIASSWFVAYDGGGDPEKTATLLVEEREPDTYHGFWSYRADRADQTLTYLRAEYGGSGGTSGTTDHDSTAP